MIDARQVKDMLNARAEEVCRYLLPAGKRDKQEWCVGSIRGQAGGSLRIHLEGAKAGVWCDFKEGPRGSNLLELWMAVDEECKGEFKLAFTKAKEFLGIREEQYFAKPSKVVGREEASGKRQEAGSHAEAQRARRKLDEEFVPLKKDGAAWKYLTGERKLSEKALEVYQVGESRDGKYIVFPSRDWNGELVSLKFLALERDENSKKKMFVLPKDGPKVLFGIQAVPDDIGALALTEGEIDALTMFDYGWPAVSVPFGAKFVETPRPGMPDPNDPWIEHGFDWLERFTDIVLALDGDEPGQKAAAAIAPRLGRERCRLLAYPAGCKDANECRTKLEDPEEFWEWIGQAKNFDPPELKRPSDLRKEIWEQYYPAGGVEPGDELPWALPFRLRDSEITVWQGYAKHGKTIGLNNVMTWVAARYGRKMCLASFEIPAHCTLKNMGRNIMGKSKPADESEFDRLIDWMDGHILVYNYLGQCEIDKLLMNFAYTAKKYGVKHFVIDSLMKLVLQSEEQLAVTNFMNQLCEFAVKYNCHIHIVAHSKKPDSKHPEEKYAPDKYSIKGFSEIVNMAHNVVCIWRNGEKEAKTFELQRKAFNGDPAAALELEELDAKHGDAKFLVQAQRGGNGDTPMKWLWYDHKESWQFIEAIGNKPVNYLDGEKPWEGISRRGTEDAERN